VVFGLTDKLAMLAAHHAISAFYPLSDLSAAITIPVTNAAKQQYSNTSLTIWVTTATTHGTTVNQNMAAKY
jgi:hypothetical protein